MPKCDIPSEDNESVNSSLLSLSSNENGSASNHSMASSISLGLNNPSHPNELPQHIFNPLPNFQPSYRDPTLDAVLRKACSEIADLDTVTHIQLRVSPNVFGLHQMHIFLPNLIALNLDGSSLESLRDLGCDLKLKYLNVSRCGLKSFDGISGFDTVEHLIADGNEISNVMQLGGLQELHTISLRGNKIKQINAISFLTICPKLNNLDLSNNAVTNIPDYRNKIKVTLPSLLILDGFGFDELAATNANATDCSSSLTSELSKDSSSLISEPNTSSRPMSSTNRSIDAMLIDSSQRPSTTESSSCCSSREPIVGNIVNKVRRIRKHQKLKQTKSSESSLTSFSSLIESNSKIDSNGFPAILPQSTVALELGVIDTEPNTASSTSNSEYDVHQLIEMCRRWRELSRKSRNTLNSGACNDQSE